LNRGSLRICPPHDITRSVIVDVLLQRLSKNTLHLVVVVPASELLAANNVMADDYTSSAEPGVSAYITTGHVNRIVHFTAELFSATVSDVSWAANVFARALLMFPSLSTGE